MKKKRAGKIVAGMVLVCFFTTSLCFNTFARDASEAVLSNEEKALYVAEIIKRLEAILEPRKETITIDDIEHMVVETNYLHEELFASLFPPDGVLVIESDDACASILVVASLYTLRGITLVLSLLRNVLQGTHTPPLTPLGELRAVIQLIRKLVNVVLNAPVAGTNGLLTFIQYLSCRQSPERS
jgi:hypothetical protein